MADITKIQPIGDSTQYELGARYLTTARTLTIGNTGKTFNGTADISWSKTEILGSSSSANFYRGDQSWSNTLGGNFYANTIVATNTTGNGSQFGMRFSDKDNSMYGLIWTSRTANKGGFISFRQYAENSSGTLSGYMENYRFPDVTANLTSNPTYYILTSKNYNDYAPTKTGGGASGTWGINISGNAATATKATQDGSGNTITSKYVTVDTAQSISGVKTFSAQQKLAGGFITGSQATSGSGSGVNIGTDGGIEIFHNSTPFIDFHYQYATKDYSVRLICNGDGQLSCTGKFYGAVWNDYAEYRETKESIEPGRCIVETGNGDLILSTKRLQEGCEIVSDTFGFAIGQNEKNNTPTATSGRVLTYLYENKEQARPGQPVCSGPNGTVSLMTNEEAREWPWCIIGTISEIPNYDIWYAGSNKDHPIKVNGRVWVRVR